MAWVYLFVAGLFEIGWAVGLKYTHGFTRPLPVLFTLASMIASFALLALALRQLPSAPTRCGPASHRRQFPVRPDRSVTSAARWPASA